MSDDSEKNVAQASATASVTASASATATLGFKADNIRNRLDDDELVYALLLGMTKGETVLSTQLRHHFEVGLETFDELCGNRSLGWYLSKCNEFDVTDEQYREALDDLVDKRNDLAHDHRYEKTLREDEDERQEVREILKETCEWIESVAIRKGDD